MTVPIMVSEAESSDLTACEVSRRAVASSRLSAQFPEEVLEEADHLLPLNIREWLAAGSVDLRHLPFITIDDPDACDLDDAIHVERTGDEWCLRVAIADVAAYVRPGSAIDSEAFNRATSVYLPGLTLPMLPERLSGDLCSLLPDQERHCVVATLEITAAGHIRSSRFERAIIRSQQRLSYADADKRRVPASLEKLADDIFILAGILGKQALNRGYLNLELPEPQPIFAPDGTISGLRRRQRLESHKVIEHFMIAAGCAAAEALKLSSNPTIGTAIFRRHPQTSTAQLRRLYRTSFPDAPRTISHRLTHHELLRALMSCSESETDALVKRLAIWRLQRPAEYSPSPGYHSGLGLPAYTHFTSPIRRYADLLAHRALMPDGAPLQNFSAEQAAHLNRKERDAVSITRTVTSKICGDFLRLEGKSHDAVALSRINGRTEFFLPEYGLSGFEHFFPIVSERRIGETERTDPENRTTDLSQPADHIRPRRRHRPLMENGMSRVTVTQTCPDTGCLSLRRID